MKIFVAKKCKKCTSYKLRASNNSISSYIVFHSSDLDIVTLISSSLLWNVHVK